MTTQVSAVPATSAADSQPATSFTRNCVSNSSPEVVTMAPPSTGATSALSVMRAPAASISPSIQAPRTR